MRCKHRVRGTNLARRGRREEDDLVMVKVDGMEEAGIVGVGIAGGDVLQQEIGVSGEMCQIFGATAF